VHHRVDVVLSQHPVYDRSIGRVTQDERCTEDCAAVATGEVVEDHDALAALEELADDVAADVPGTAGNEDGSIHARMVPTRPGGNL
jgi:hypothetical protein